MAKGPRSYVHRLNLKIFLVFSRSTQTKDLGVRHKTKAGIVCNNFNVRRVGSFG